MPENCKAPEALPKTPIGEFTAVRDFHLVKNINALYGFCPSKVWNFPKLLSYTVKSKHKLNCFHLSFVGEVLKIFLHSISNQFLYLCACSWQLRILSDPYSLMLSAMFAIFYTWELPSQSDDVIGKVHPLGNLVSLHTLLDVAKVVRKLIYWLNRPYSYPQLNFEIKYSFIW